jgi:hypothetical protein
VEEIYAVYNALLWLLEQDRVWMWMRARAWGGGEEMGGGLRQVARRELLAFYAFNTRDTTGFGAKEIQGPEVRDSIISVTEATWPLLCPPSPLPPVQEDKWWGPPPNLLPHIKGTQVAKARLLRRLPSPHLGMDACKASAKNKQ